MFSIGIKLQNITLNTIFNNFETFLCKLIPVLKIQKFSNEQFKQHKALILPCFSFLLPVYLVQKNGGKTPSH
jgi:hypothetical protein